MVVKDADAMLPAAERINEQILRAALHQTMTSLGNMRRAVAVQEQQGTGDALFGTQGFVDQLNTKMSALEGLVFKAQPISLNDVPEWARSDVSANIDAIVRRLVKGAVQNDAALT